MQGHKNSILVWTMEHLPRSLPLEWDILGCNYGMASQLASSVFAHIVSYTEFMQGRMVSQCCLKTFQN